MFRGRCTPEPARRESHISLHWRPIALLAALALSGAAAESDAPHRRRRRARPPRPVTQSDLQIAQSIYGSAPRTPAGFYSDPPPSGQSTFRRCTSRTRTSSRRRRAATAATSCAQTTGTKRSPGRRLGAQNAAAYADLVETNDDARYFEFGRVRQGDPHVLPACASIQVRLSRSLRRRTCAARPGRRAG